MHRGLFALWWDSKECGIEHGNESASYTQEQTFVQLRLRQV
ncbi:hypothetical protein [Paenibacillus aestuarii]|uniref:Uncharacterized protein n=1 Tax=Paenibacillus aestuarii TaxID=516965 RepID=A0ABW0K5Z9_9BACL|nr:hypothetical protein [Paenibacillus aestuarii]